MRKSIVEWLSRESPSCCRLGPPVSRPAPTLQLLATYDTGLGANGERIISVRHRDGLAVLTNIAGSIDVLDCRIRTRPYTLRRVNVNTSAPAHRIQQRCTHAMTSFSW